MVLAFFDSKGRIYTNHLPRLTTNKSEVHCGSLGRFMKNLNQKRPAMAADGAPVVLEGEGRRFGEKSVRHECFLMRKLFEEKYIHIWLISRA
jgi:hypothetical protein